MKSNFLLSKSPFDEFLELRSIFTHGIFSVTDSILIQKNIHIEALLLAMKIGDVRKSTYLEIKSAEAWITCMKRVIDIHARTMSHSKDI